MQYLRAGSHTLEGVRVLLLTRVDQRTEPSQGWYIRVGVQDRDHHSRHMQVRVSKDSVPQCGRVTA